MALRRHYAMKPTAAEAGSMIYPSDFWGWLGPNKDGGGGGGMFFFGRFLQGDLANDQSYTTRLCIHPQT